MYPSDTLLKNMHWLHMLTIFVGVDVRVYRNTLIHAHKPRCVNWPSDVPRFGGRQPTKDVAFSLERVTVQGFQGLLLQRKEFLQLAVVDPSLSNNSPWALRA